MTTIRLTNSLTRRKEEFVPLDPANVRMYVCGPTVYDRAHLGNARPVVVFDVLYRLLRHVYGADHVTYVRNFTDVDDKINARAAEMKAAGDGRALEEIIRGLTDRTIRWYHEDMDALGALRPGHEPRATDWIGAMIAMIADLMAKGHAYEAEGHVLFAVESYAAYGRLSGRTVEDMIAGARVEVAPFKRNPMDFVLWKPSTPDLPGWDSPWGRGRPGWHIECSAMASELLGASFDIHGGGLDLQFPHHENEIAQSACAHPEGAFARYWLHNEMLLVDGKKMSKSLGNFFTVRDLLDGHPGEGRFSGAEIRMAFLLSHYRSEMDFSARRSQEARQLVVALSRALGQDGEETRAVIADRGLDARPLREVVEAVADDLDTPKALKALQFEAKNLPKGAEPRRARLLEIDASLRLLGFDLADTLTARDHAHNRDVVLGETHKVIRQTREDSALLEKYCAGIAAARLGKDYQESDRLRRILDNAGVSIQIAPDGRVQFERGPNFDAKALETLE